MQGRIFLVVRLISGFLIVLIHGCLNSGRNNHCHSITYGFHDFGQQFHFILGKLFKNISLYHQSIKRFSDADSHSDKVWINEAIYYGDYSFMTSMTAAYLQTDRSEREIYVIVNDDYIRWVDIK